MQMSIENTTGNDAKDTYIIALEYYRFKGEPIYYINLWYACQLNFSPKK